VRAGRFPGWVMLHGLTVMGRDHPSQVKLARALASASNVVLIPDIPEWRTLRVAPAVTLATNRAAAVTLREHKVVHPERLGLSAFSFGATQALIAAGQPAIQSILKAVVAWGGFSDLHRLFRFGMIGEHDLDGAWVLFRLLHVL
jgi:hypothetical protein